MYGTTADISVMFLYVLTFREWRSIDDYSEKFSEIRTIMFAIFNKQIDWKFYADIWTKLRF